MASAKVAPDGVKLGAHDRAQVQGDEAGACPDPTGTIEEGSPDTFLGEAKRPAAVVDDDVVVPCEDCSDGPIVTGAAHVFVNGKPWARRLDQLDCGAYVGEGEPTVLIGGEPSAEPGESRLDLECLGHGPIHGGAEVAVDLGHQLAGGGVAEKLALSRPTGAAIGNHLARTAHAARRPVVAAP